MEAPFPWSVLWLAIAMAVILLWLLQPRTARTAEHASQDSAKEVPAPSSPCTSSPEPIALNRPRHVAQPTVEEIVQGLEQPDSAWTSAYCLRPYHPRRRGSNRSFGPLDKRLLAFKCGQPKAVAAEVENFRRALVALRLSGPARLVVMPGHLASESNATSPLSEVAWRLADTDPALTATTSCIVRTQTITKLSHGGPRAVGVHLRSLAVRGEGLTGETVIILDDVLTTGNSIAAARHLLLAAGASRVAAVVLGRTSVGINT